MSVTAGEHRTLTICLIAQTWPQPVQEITFLWQMTRLLVLNTGKKLFIDVIGTPRHIRRNTTMGEVSRLMSVKLSGPL